jgi:hypothetical protein
MMPLDQVRARLADGAPLSPWDARRASVHATRPLTRTSYGRSAAEFNATLPPEAHEAATARAIEAACGLSDAPSLPHPHDAYDRAVATAESDAREVNESFDASAPTPEQLKAAGLVRRTIEHTTNSQTGPIYTSRGFAPTAAGRRLLGRVARYVAGGGQLPVQSVADILRKCAGLRPAVSMPAPHPFFKGEYARPDEVVAEAAKLSEQQERGLMARLGFHARANSTRRLDNMQRLLLRRDSRDAELLGLVRCERYADHDTLITTAHGARQAAEISAPARTARAA